MMNNSTTLRRGRLRSLYGNVYSTGYLRTRSQTRKYTYPFFLPQTAHEMYCLPLIYIYIYMCVCLDSLCRDLTFFSQTNIV